MSEGRGRSYPPLAQGSTSVRPAPWKSAVFRVANEFVQVWAIVLGTEHIEATYTSPWEVQELDRAGREALVASLRLD